MHYSVQLVPARPAQLRPPAGQSAPRSNPATSISNKSCSLRRSHHEWDRGGYAENHGLQRFARFCHGDSAGLGRTSSSLEGSEVSGCPHSEIHATVPSATSGPLASPHHPCWPGTRCRIKCLSGQRHQTSFLPYSARVVELADRLDDPGQHQPAEHLVTEAARQKRSLPNDTTLHLTGWPNHSSRWARNATGPRGGGGLTRQIEAGTPGGAEGTDNPMTHDH